MEINSKIVSPANFSEENWTAYFDNSSDIFTEKREKTPKYKDSDFTDLTTLGKLDFEDGSTCAIFLIKSERPLSERASRRKQFDKATQIIKQEYAESGLFVFYDERHHFRYSLVYPVYKGTKRAFSNYRRHSFYVSGDLPNKTYVLQLSKYKLNSMADLQDIFSVDKVSDLFYEEFEKENTRLKACIKNSYDQEVDDELLGNFALLFVIRIIFLGFVQKKGWLGDNTSFIKDYLGSYDPSVHQQGIYQDLLCPLFFTALNSAPSTKNKFGFPAIAEPYKTALVNAPFLNGGLFRKHENYDLDAIFITDEGIRAFVDFLFSFNFTLEENTLYDEELELNPEFLGIIFEKLINKAHGAIYTPRLEVDFMCRLSLVKYLQQNCLSSIGQEDIYKLFFPEYGDENDQTAGDFTEAEAKDLLEKLESVTVCDPAIGSGAFAVGMLNVIDEIECSIYKQFLPKASISSPYERKKRIIFQSLYGVEVKQWAVWITQLRLWITLLIEAEDSFKHSEEPLLPSFDFKIRQGDSLIQMLGNSLFPVSGEGIIAPDLKRKISDLVKLKTEYYFNKSPHMLHDIELKHKKLYLAILDKKKKDLNQKLSRMKGDVTREVQASLFETDIQTEIELVSKQQTLQIEELECQIRKVDQEINQINIKNLPFVWRIDFPEIFIEKGGFDLVIGNPPYVAQEDIEDPLGKITENKKYKELLKQMAVQDFPQDLSISAISGKSDLYTFFYIRGIKLLNKQGVLTFICSNSWLDVEFGAWLQKFLLERCQTHFIIDNLAKRVFKNAGINTIISMIGAWQRTVRADDLIRFAAFKLPFENSLYTENFLTIEESTNRIDFDDLRVNPVSRAKLTQEGWENSSAKKYKGSKWGGIYLKAPNIYFTIMEKAKDKLVKLGDIADVKFGIKTGANEFFYFQKGKPEIELLGQENFTSAIRSPSEIKGIKINENWLENNILIIDTAKSLIQNDHLLEYIQNGENQGYHLRPTIKTRTPWYSLPKQEISDFVQGQIINERFIFCLNQRVQADCVLNQIYLKEEYKGYAYEILLALNCSLTAFLSELNGRTALGEGALKIQVFELRNLLIVNPSLLAEDIHSSEIIHQLADRDILSIFRELQVDPESGSFMNANPLPDRKALDEIVFNALGFTQQEARALYAGLLELTANRLRKAKTFLH